MRHLAIGDIHGCFTALTTLAAHVPFEPTDTLITLGDYVNRGPDSFAVLNWLIAQRHRGQLIAIRGNHEVMMLEARDSDLKFSRWQHCGGAATLASYSPLGDGGRLADVPEEHWQFLEATKPFFEIDTHFFVHANAHADYPLAEQPEYMLYWETFGNPAPHESGKIMICGHTSQKSGQPRNVGHAICIDTWVYGDGWLTCLDVGSGKYWQANQHGATRSGCIDECN
jgi:serine/threonine protein phosphatase 1